jgi:hypothetical protein
MPAISWNQNTSPGRIILKAVERTLDVPIDYLSFAELNATVRAFVAEAAHLTRLVAPEDHLLAHARHTHWLVPNLLRFHQNIPLVRDHSFSPRESSKGAAAGITVDF